MRAIAHNLDGVLTMKAGTTEKFDCEGCSTEFSVTYEPKATGKPKEAEGIPDMPVEHCPFCGQLLPIDTEDEEVEDERGE